MVAAEVGASDTYFLIHLKFHIFGHIQPLMFVVAVILFYLNIFSQIHPYFGQVRRLTFVDVSFRSCSNVKVHCCQIFLVKFYPIFGYLDSVN